MEMKRRELLNITSGSFCSALALFIIYLTLTTFVEEDISTGGPFANSAFYPKFVAGTMIFLSILLIISSLVKKPGKPLPPPAKGREQAGPKISPDETKSLQRDGVSRKVLIAVAFVLILYTSLLDMFGYLLLTPFLMALLFWMLNIRKWITITLLSITSTAALYVFFSSVLEIILPPGRYSLIGW